MVEDHNDTSENSLCNVGVSHELKIATINQK